MPDGAENSQIRTGIVGFGLSGSVFHAPFLAANPRFALSVIATSNHDRQAQARAKYPDADIVDTPEALFARDLDLVVLASPPHVHREQALAAFDRGMSVLIDKPFAPSVDDAEAIIQAADEAGRQLIVFQNRRWDGDFLTVADLVANGTLGEVHRFESSFERWSEPKVGRWQNELSVAQGGGVLFDLGSHLIDQALQLFGPASLAHSEVRTIHDGSSTDDDAFISLQHDSGVASHLTVSRAAAATGPRMRVLGTEGAYVTYGLDGQEAALKDGAIPSDQNVGAVPEAQWGSLMTAQSKEVLPTYNGDYRGFYESVAAAVLDGAPLPVDPQSALEVVRIIEEAHSHV